MTVYFIRHGEGHHNANNLYSLPEFELTEKGKEEAMQVAKRVKSLPIEILIVSPYKRTVQTAEIINKEINKPLIFSDLAIEVIRPTEIAGKSIDAVENQAIRKQLDDNFHLPDWHYSDEENFFDLRTRAINFIHTLEKRPEEHILVVTHGVFIKMVILTMMLKEKLTPEIFLRGFSFMHLATSGLTITKFQKEDWRLISWNDHSHLT